MGDEPDVTMRLPAERAYAAVLRSTTAALAARLDFTVEDLDDLRTAVGEVTAMLLEQARPGAALLAEWRFGEREITLLVTTEADDPHRPDVDGLAWQVLVALTTGASAHLGRESLGISMALKSAPLE